MTTSNLVLFLLLAFTVKHLIVDFFLQVPFMYLNKGTYGHPGGLYHAGLHGVSTFAVMAIPMVFWPELRLIDVDTIMLATVLDTVIHYHVDWAKMNLNRVLDWGPTHEGFWWLLGIDQFLHSITYLGLVYVWKAGII